MIRFELFLAILFGLAVSGKCQQRFHELKKCDEVNSQHSLNIPHITGGWYTQEIVFHNKAEESHESLPGECIMIHISDEDPISNTKKITYNYDNDQSNHYLKMRWDERNTKIDYMLYFNNQKRGYWTTSNSVPLTTLHMPNSEFIGTVHVLKAVGNQLILTFCELTPKKDNFSLILSRKPNSLSIEEIISVKSMFARRGLSAKNTQKICIPNSSEALFKASNIIVTLLTVTILSKIF